MNFHNLFEIIKIAFCSQHLKDLILLHSKIETINSSTKILTAFHIIDNWLSNPVVGWWEVCIWRSSLMTIIWYAEVMIPSKNWSSSTDTLNQATILLRHHYFHWVQLQQEGSPVWIFNILVVWDLVPLVVGEASDCFTKFCTNYCQGIVNIITILMKGFGLEVMFWTSEKKL